MLLDVPTVASIYMHAYFFSVSMYLTQHCGMAATNSDNVVWHTSLTALPNIPGDTVERFVSMQSVAKET
jgi:hypothetical protein